MGDFKHTPVTDVEAVVDEDADNDDYDYDGGDRAEQGGWIFSSLRSLRA